MNNQRDLSIDYAKGFAMLLIVIGHVYFFSDRSEGSWIWRICNTTQIPIFMFISGLLAYKSINKYDFGTLIKKRALRLLLPFFSFYILWGIYIPDTFRSLPLDQFKQGLWFVLVLFEIDVLFSFSKYISNKYNHPILPYHILFFFIITLFVSVAPQGNTIRQLLSVNLLWHYYPFFMLGYYSSHLNKLFKLKYAIVYILIYIIALYYLYTYNIKYITPICNVVSLLFWLTIIKRLRPMETIFTKIGYYSLQIYLLHFWIIHFSISYMPIINNRWIECGVVVCVALVITLVSIVIAYMLMKNKWISLLLFGIKNNSQMEKPYPVKKTKQGHPQDDQGMKISESRNPNFPQDPKNSRNAPN